MERGKGKLKLDNEYQNIVRYEDSVLVFHSTANGLDDNVIALILLLHIVYVYQIVTLYPINMYNYVQNKDKAIKIKFKNVLYI
jgi:phosphomannomutase